MGTRHVIKIINHGKEVVSQYGQWDGYPSVVIGAIRDYIHDYGVDSIRKSLAHISPQPFDEMDRLIWSECTIGAVHAFSDIEAFSTDQVLKACHVGGMTAAERQQELLEKFGWQRGSLYLMMTRDTGYMILDALKNIEDRNTEGAEVKSFLFDGDMGRTYTIDLDHEELKMNCFDTEMVWNLGQLPDNDTLEQLDSLQK